MGVEKIVVPDFGEVQEITVVEVYIRPGESVEVESPLIALESEKAVMDIPSPYAGKITAVYVTEDDRVKSGDLIAEIELAAEDSELKAQQAQPGEKAPEKHEEREPGREKTKPREEKVEEQTAQPAAEEQGPGLEQEGRGFHATPSVRSYARELGVALARVKPTGPKGRILREDVRLLVKQVMKGGEVPSALGEGLSVDEQPLEDFSVYGEVEEVRLGRIKKISGPHLHRSWVAIPHVTHFEEADVTELETFRAQMNEEAGKDGLRFSPLVFIIKAVVATLKEYPIFNCSLMPGGEKVVIKKYYNIGIAVDTPDGLVVPVIRDADKKGMREIARELKTLSEAARAGKLMISDLQGASFTISSLGGIGGSGFTPIINAPQVAILGLSRNCIKPVWNDSEEQFVPRLTLPFSLSYDHRVIDGAEAARFCWSLKRSIEDLRRALL